MKKGVFFIIVFYISNLLIESYFDLHISVFQITLIHTFLFGSFVLKDRIHQMLIQKNTKHPFSFLAINVLSFFICLLFLIPFILSTDSNSQLTVVCSFFICFFIYLFLELFLILKK